jgi:hypothetical protein
MAKWTLSSYNRAIGRAMTQYSLTRKEAAQWYRELRGLKGSPVFRADIKSHPRWSKKASELAKRRGAPPTKLLLPPEPEPEFIEEEEEFIEEEFDEEEYP